MVSPHISISEELDYRIKVYCEKNKLKYSQGIRKLVEFGLSSLENKVKLDKFDLILDRIYSKQLYIRDLLEQLYTDLEIDVFLNPKENLSLQKFKNIKNKDKFND